MARKFLHDLLEEPEVLARFQGWSEEVYRDFLSLQRGALSEPEFDRKYLVTRAILTLDMTGFTQTSIREGSLHALLRIFDVQKVCLPVLQENKAELIRVFADDLVALFESPDAALDAAFEIHARVASFNESVSTDPDPAECCVGIGYGAVYRIGPNHAMGDEMNRASKLGEDTARGSETLITEGAYSLLKRRSDARFEAQTGDDLLFPYYRATPRG